MKNIILAAFLAAGVGLPAYAADLELQVVDKGCWIEIFEDNGFDADDPHMKIQGPIEFATLKDLSGRNWSDDIESLIVGHNAMVKAYKDKDFRGTQISFTADQRVPDLGEVDMGNEIESMIVSCGS